MLFKKIQFNLNMNFYLLIISLLENQNWQMYKTVVATHIFNILLNIQTSEHLYIYTNIFITYCFTLLNCLFYWFLKLLSLMNILMVRKSVISLWYLYGIQENFADAIPKLLHDSFYSRQKVNKSRSTAVLFFCFLLIHLSVDLSIIQIVLAKTTFINFFILNLS